MLTKFELTQEQEDRVDNWAKEHTLKHPNGIKDCTGAYLEFSFIPTGLGTNTRVKCIWCNNGIDVTQDSDDGTFISDLEEKQYPGVVTFDQACKEYRRLLEADDLGGNNEALLLKLWPGCNKSK